MNDIANLRPWKPGQSGNPAGKPVGAKHLSTWIREMVEDENFTVKLANGTVVNGAPIKAVVKSLIIKSLEGDLKAIDLLAKYGYGTKVNLNTKEHYIDMDFGSGSRHFVRHTEN